MVNLGYLSSDKSTAGYRCLSDQLTLYSTATVNASLLSGSMLLRGTTLKHSSAVNFTKANFSGSDEAKKYGTAQFKLYTCMWVHAYSYPFYVSKSL